MHPDLPARLRARLKKSLPGKQAHIEMAPPHRVHEELSDAAVADFRPSAVLILLCRRTDNQWFIPLTLRAEYAGAHSAQVSLPGGKYDRLDGTLAQTALRECREEIGLWRGIELVGPLSKLYIPVSRYMVQPYVAFNTESEIEYQSEEREVKALIELPLHLLLNDTTISKGVVMHHEGKEITAPYFDYDTHRIWGATAMILNELKCVIKETL